MKQIYGFSIKFMHLRKKSLLYLIIILILASSLRLFRLSDVPPGLNRDEASIGYNAYSLLQTGKDEYGLRWPFSFKSFGDWKLPLYIYLTIPFVVVFGLTEVSVRLPSAISGIATVFVVYLLTYEIFKYIDKSNRKKGKKGIFFTAENISLLSAFLFAISPWSLFMSRNASESNTAVFLVSLGLYFFYRSFSKNWLILIAFFFMALTLYTYHGNHIFTLLLLFGLCLVYREKLLTNKWFFPGLGVFILLSVLIFRQTLWVADKTKISGLSLLSDESKIYENITLRRLEYQTPNLLSRIFHNKPFFLVKTIFINYVRGLSPEFLFISGGTNHQHNIPDFGNLYLWEVIVLPVAIYKLFRSKDTHAIFLLVWLFISPIAASITRDAPHTNRMMGILPLPAILSGYGIAVVMQWLQQKNKLLNGSILIIMILSISLASYLEKYYIHFPFKSAKYWGNAYREMVYSVNNISAKYPEIYISQPDRSPYIYFLFYGKVNPNTYHNEVIRYPETTEGFQHVKQLGKLYFKKFNWTSELLVPNRLYIDWVEGVPDSATQSSILITQKLFEKMQETHTETAGITVGSIITSRIVKTIRTPDASPLIYFIETNISSPSASKYAN